VATRIAAAAEKRPVLPSLLPSPTEPPADSAAAAALRWLSFFFSFQLPLGAAAGVLVAGALLLAGHGLGGADLRGLGGGRRKKDNLFHYSY